MPELHKRRDPGIKGYDPTKKGRKLTMHHCPHCWFAHHAKNVMTKHINDRHWDIKDE